MDNGYNFPSFIIIFFYIPLNALCSLGNNFHYFRGLCNSLPGAREDHFKDELFYFCATEQIIITVILIITIINTANKHEAQPQHCG